MPDYDSCNGDEDYYCHCTGTSFSAPIVAALAAKLLRIKNDIIPFGSTAEPLYEILRNSAYDLGPPGHDSAYGWGRVSAYRAMVAISRGDANNDYTVNVSDASYIINYTFAGGPEPIPYLYIGDANCDGTVNVSDAVRIINYVFAGGLPPAICFLNLPE